MSRYVPQVRSGLLLPQRLSAQMNSAYEGGSASGSRVRNWNPSGAGPNAAATQSLGLMRRRARDATRNDPWAHTAESRWNSNVVGTGIQPHPQHPDPTVRKALKTLFADWVSQADADDRLDFYGLQSLAVRAIFTDGETLTRMRLRRPQDGLVVPLQLQALEGDYLPIGLTQQAAGGNEVIDGVEFNQIGKRVRYHLYRSHPGEYGRGWRGAETTPVPADQVVHAYPVLRAGQVRGVTALASVLLRLKSIDNLDDAVMYRQEVSNLFAGFVTRPVESGLPPDPLNQAPYGVDVDGTPMVSLEPGTMQELEPGQEVTFSAPPDAGANYGEFMRQQLMAAFASTGIPYEIAAGDLRGVSDRTLRVIVNEFHRLVEQFQWHCVIHQWCRPIWAAWLDALMLSGRFPMPDFYRNRHLYLRVQWVPQGWPYFNPTQDIEAKRNQVRAGFTSRAAVVLAQGDDPDQLVEEIAAEQDEADRRGFVFDSDPRRTDRSGGQVDAPSDPGDGAV
ncbi:phage portal protein%2C lambda family [Bordetella ansorpii]|uniref:Phage portal protein, lambda family n=1 Tax=Bordetella ansorpii TaxID=288768 RepID=A0A157RM56_9BORD|nr:phage portal protein [Bordetella ansorpii]SAI58946.1 phage portal protein%2C lambda family [Bordetella ansorpii]